MELRRLLAALQEPAFFADGAQTVAFGNEAFYALGFSDGDPLPELLPIDDALQAEDGTFACTVGRRRCIVRTLAQPDGALYMLQPQRTEVSANALAHTARRLRGTLQQMYSALDTLDGCLSEEDETLDKTLSSLLQGVFRIERMADNLSYLQRLRSGEYAPRIAHMDLTEKLTALLEKAEGLLREADIRLDWSLPSKRFVGNMDEALLTLAFWNLLSNAAANAAGGTVTVRVERARLTRLRLFVSDSGSGIPAERMADLTERFAAPTESALAQDGVGLGLSLIRSVAELLDGKLAILHEAGGTTTAALELRTDLPAAAELHSDVQTFTHSLDDGLVGLSDVLPRKVYDRRDVLA